jgi:hypothetical protein
VSWGKSSIEGMEDERSDMGILWEILQSGFIYHQKRKSDSIGDRVDYLEDQLRRTQDTIVELVKKIEDIHGLDVDGDGKVG